MSLFPAYTNDSEKPNTQSASDQVDQEWLTNSSFGIPLPQGKKEEEVQIIGEIPLPQEKKEDELQVIKFVEYSPTSREGKRELKRKRRQQRRREARQKKREESRIQLSSGATEKPNTQSPNDQVDQEWLTNSSFGIPLPQGKKEEEVQIIGETPLPQGKKEEEVQIIGEIPLPQGKIEEEVQIIGDIPLPQEKEESEVQVENLVEESALSSAVKKKLRRKRWLQRKRETQQKRREERQIYISSTDAFVIDKTRQLSYLSAKTLTRPLKPRYKVKIKSLTPRYIEIKKMKIKRYFKSVGNLESFTGGTLEEETIVSKKTEEFNKKLTEDPHDIQTWVDFVKFQDEFYKYQHIRYRSLVDRERAADQHKLSILDRAVAKNPDNKELQSLWLKIGTSVLPSEEMSSRIDKILEDSGGTMTLWLGLMTTTQHSLARCTVPSVTKLYEKLLINFQKVKMPDVYGRDLNVLELLFHYGRFLDHCGHWEILWLMLKVNLQFNVKVDINFQLEVDNKVRGLENEVLEKEKQAVWQMWSKLERIREGLHFLPDAESMFYPQRCVEPETIVNFTWHFHPDLHFQLIISFIMLLKVPLLLATDTVLKFLIPNALPWVFDSPEYILSAVLISPAVSLKCGYLSPIVQLSRGPQYLRGFHGQLEFFNILNRSFEACLKCLEGRKKTALGVLWLRFQRWIHLLNKLQLIPLPDDKKPVKTFFKEFLKMPENRDNLVFYIEYSLFEFNQGNTETCIKTLKTLIQSQPPVLSLNDKKQKEAVISVYRTLCEVLVGTDQRKAALDLLINLGSGNAWDCNVTIHSLVAAEKKFDTFSVELINELESSTSCSLEDLLMPILAVDWISCYFWLIALVKTPTDLKNCYKKIFAMLDNQTGVLADQIRECLWETVVIIIWVFDRNSHVHSKEILINCTKTYPQNLRFLLFMAESDIENNTYWWAVKNTFLSNPTVFSCIFLICLALDRFKEDKEKFHNRVKNLLQSVALREGKLSSMIHCLRLRFLLENENVHLEVAQLQALESCPWNKSIYMDSILILPAKLMQLTDVLIEKELRIHITPDEIQEMRD